MRQAQDRMPLDADGRAKLYADIAHPINSICREMIQDCVVREYEEEVERAKQPDYVSRYDDFDMDYGDFRRPQQPAGTAETRIDPPHDRRGAHAVQHRSAPDGQRPRTAAPPSRAAAPQRDGHAGRESRDGFGGFGAGIFPER